MMLIVESLTLELFYKIVEVHYHIVVWVYLYKLEFLLVLEWYYIPVLVLGNTVVWVQCYIAVLALFGSLLLEHFHIVVLALFWVPKK